MAQSAASARDARCKRIFPLSGMINRSSGLIWFGGQRPLAETVIDLRPDVVRVFEQQHVIALRGLSASPAAGALALRDRAGRRRPCSRCHRWRQHLSYRPLRDPAGRHRAAASRCACALRADWNVPLKMQLLAPRASHHAAAKAAAQDAKTGKWNTRAVIKNAESPDNILSWIGRAGQCARFCGWNNLREFRAELYMGTLL